MFKHITALLLLSTACPVSTNGDATSVRARADSPDARVSHTYRFVLGETSQENYIDGVLVWAHSFAIPRGTAWVFSATTDQSTTNGEIDSVTVQSQATCGRCSSPPSP